MSLITLNRAIVPSLWPGSLSQLAARRHDPQVRTSWRYVPETSDDLFEWAIIVDDTSPDARPGQRHLVYSPDVTEPMWNTDDSDKHYDVVVNLHGFLQSGDLSALGNWAKRANNAPSAQHTLVLTSAGCFVPFNAQKQALERLTQHIILKAGAIHVPDFGDENEIKLDHQVFTKVRDPSTAERPPPRGEDISAYLRERDMYRLWALQPLPVFIRRPSGVETPICPTALRRGDFLEVSVIASIQRLRRNGRVGTAVNFPIVRIVRLLPALEAKKILPSHNPSSLAPAFVLPPT